MTVKTVKSRLGIIQKGLFWFFCIVFAEFYPNTEIDGIRAELLVINRIVYGLLVFQWIDIFIQLIWAMFTI